MNGEAKSGAIDSSGATIGSVGADGMNIQWFPGHMTKARRMIEDNLRLIDAVCEIIDARIPISSRNPVLGEIISGKPRLIIMNRVDQADAGQTKRWAAYFKSQGFAVLETDCKTGRGVGVFSSAVRSLLAEKLARYEERGQTGRTLRVMVVGIPNVGKSSFINRVAKRRAANTSDKPGVTRGKQWITIGPGLELLDTPGVLWPKFESREVGENLAFTGAVRDEILDTEMLGALLMVRLGKSYPDRLRERYSIDAQPDTDGLALLTAAAKRRGFLISGGELDLARMSAVLLDEFRGGKLGRITLERPEDIDNEPVGN